MIKKINKWLNEPRYGMDSNRSNKILDFAILLLFMLLLGGVAFT